jgi:hypothetical protein
MFVFVIIVRSLNQDKTNKKSMEWRITCTRPKETSPLHSGISLNEIFTGGVFMIMAVPSNVARVGENIYETTILKFYE